MSEKKIELTLEKLLEFNLLHDSEIGLIENKGSQKLLEIVHLIQEILSVDQFIKDSPSYPGSTDKIIRGEMIAGIGATLAIEGTNLNSEEIEESLRKADMKQKLERREQEAENSRNVYNFIIELIKNNDVDFKITEPMIKQIHKIITSGIDYLGNVPGSYRGNFQATFGHPRREGLCKTTIEIETAMKGLIEAVNSSNADLIGGNRFAKAIMAHYYLTEIHPFGDGNGRTARAVEALLLYKAGINPYCFWALANFWSINRDKYIFGLGDIFTTCDPIGFVGWGLNGYYNEIKRIKGKVLTKMKQLMLMDYARHLLSAKSINKTKINQRIIDVLRIVIRRGKKSSVEFYNLPEISGLYKSVSTVTRYRDFKTMEELKLIKFVHTKDETLIEPNFNVLDRITYNI